MARTLDPAFGRHPIDLVQHYLRAFGLCGVHIIGPEEGRPIRIGHGLDAQRRARSLQAGGWSKLVVHGVFWVRGEDAASQIAGTARAASGPVIRSGWIDTDAAGATAAISRAADHHGLRTTAHATVASRVCAALDHIDRVIAARKKGGDLSDLNRQYRTMRLAAEARGEKVESYNRFVLTVAKTMIDNLALTTMKNQKKKAV